MKDTHDLEFGAVTQNIDLDAKVAVKRKKAGFGSLEFETPGLHKKATLHPKPSNFQAYKLPRNSLPPIETEQEEAEVVE